MSFGQVARWHKMPLDSTAFLDTFLPEKVSKKNKVRFIEEGCNYVLSKNEDMYKSAYRK